MYQRFGQGGGTTAAVGFLLLQGKWKEAVLYIMAPREGENRETHAALTYYLRHLEDPQVRDCTSSYTKKSFSILTV